MSTILYKCREVEETQELLRKAEANLSQTKVLMVSQLKLVNELRASLPTKAKMYVSHV